MKVTVRKPIIDRYTGEYYEAGKTLDLPKERVEEIMSVDPDLVKVDKKTVKKTKKK